LIYSGYFKKGRTQDLWAILKTVVQMQAFAGNGNEHVLAVRDPDLYLDLVLVGAIKRLNAELL